MKKDGSSELTVNYLPTESLTAYPNNSRTHSLHQTRQIAASIQTFGFTNPVLIDRKNIVIAGHGRVAAAKLLGMKLVPTIRLENLTEDQIRAYILADNKLAENAGWDGEILAIELQHLLTIEGNFDVSITGFEVPEIDLIIEEGRAEKQDQDDRFQIDETQQAVTQPGDLWQLGNHRVLCANSLVGASFKSLMGRRQADLVFTDPPYNIAIDGNVSGKGLVRHPDFVMGSGEMDEAQFVAFLTSILRLLARYSTGNSVHFICMGWQHMKELLAAGEHIYDAFLNLCVWVKDHGGQGSLYRSRHELIFVFRNGKSRNRNNVQLGQYGRNRTNVWQFLSAKTFSQSGDEGNLLGLHPTVKPVQMVADAMLDCSARGDVVLDSFLGSGTTLIAAERVSRICYGIEIDPHYVDVAIRRWQKHTGDHALHVASRRSFDEIAAIGEVGRG